MTRRGISANGRAVDRDARQDRRARPAALVRLLAEQVLDPQDVGERQVAMVALELLGQRRPADPATAVDVGHLAQLVGAGRLAQVRAAARARGGRGRRSAPARRPSGRAARRGRGRSTTVVGPSRSSAATTSSTYVSNVSSVGSAVRDQ